MADPTTVIELTEIQNTVSYHAGFGNNYSGLADPGNEKFRVDEAIKSGVARVYYKPMYIVPQTGKRLAHEWSFMRKRLPLNTTNPYKEGTIGIASGVVTLTSGTWPSWAAQGDLSVTGGVYDVATRDSDTQITLEDTSVDKDAGESYTLRQRWYDLPDDFGQMDEEIMFERYHAIAPIKKTSAAIIRSLRQQNFDEFRPKFYYFRQKEQDGSAMQKSEIEFYPVADQQYELEGEYTILINALTSGAAYPVGDASQRELLIESCLAAYDRRFGIQDVDHESIFKELLQDAITHDIEHRAPSWLGRNTDRFAVADRNLGSTQNRADHRTNLGFYVTVNEVIPDSDP